MGQKLQFIKNVLGKEYKLILVFLGVALFNLLFNYWLINFIGFIANVLLIGYIITSTNNKVVLKTVESIKRV